MKNELSIRTVLSVYEKIIDHGEVVDERHVLEGITAYTDHDGYTVYLEGQRVKLWTGFHNTYHLDYESERDAENFMKKLNYIDNNYD
ncbi:MAG: DUF3081 domain-containing protein [Aliidiomarina sp.]|uniref:DUF3081 family protein n=1 Tax=Aliidiomarina sp. TaxID=1872439 RepID=UPI0025B7BB11|nr:DUF3081 family protein [Aliidiomarina sp.]MCH8500704.1 DUF3081 domain-containing protein [Aliidiomarina sp.]